MIGQAIDDNGAVKLGCLYPQIRRQVSNEHMSCAVCNSEGDLAFHQNVLRGDSARVKNRDFIRRYIDWLTPVCFGNILDAKRHGSTNRDWASMGMSVFGCDLNVLRYFHSRYGLHAYNHVPLQRSGGPALERSFVHWDILALLSALERDAGIEQGTIVTEGTTNQKCNGLFRPVLRNVSHFLFDFSITIDSISVN